MYSVFNNGMTDLLGGKLIFKTRLIAQQNEPMKTIDRVMFVEISTSVLTQCTTIRQSDLTHLYAHEKHEAEI